MNCENKIDFFNTNTLLRIKNDVIIGASNLLFELTEYNSEDILNKELYHVWTNILRISIKPDKLSINTKAYMFTKSRKPISIIINKHSDQESDQIVYTIEPQECEILTKSFSFMKDTYKNTDYGVAIYSVPEFILLDANTQYLDYIKRRNHDIIGLSIYDFTQYFQIGRSYDKWNYVCKTGKTFYSKEYLAYDEENNIEYWNYTIKPIIEDSSVKYLITIMRSLTETVVYKKSLQQQASTIKKQNEELEAVINNMSDAIYIFDDKNNFIIKNKAAAALFPTITHVGEEYYLAEFLDMNGKKLRLEDMPVMQIRNGVNVRNKQLILINQNELNYVSVSGTPIFDSQGNFRLGIMSSRDITNSVQTEIELRNIQEQILRSEIEKNEILEKSLNMKDDFLSLISHEFKTPLTVIYSALQTIDFLYKDQLPQKVNSFLNNIKQNTFRQLRLVNNLLDITRVKAGHFKIIKKNLDIVLLTKYITGTVQIYAELKQLRLDFESEISSKIIAIDEEKYERIMLNLLSNAIKYTQQNKSICVRIDYKPATNMVSIEVIDEGIGIPNDKQELIFQRFGQVESDLSRQAEGTGIGLYLVKLLVDELGGSIELISEVGVGSTFRVLLPAVQVDEAECAPSSCDKGSNNMIQNIAIELSDIYM